MQYKRRCRLTSRMPQRTWRLGTATLLAVIMLILLGPVPTTAAASGIYTEDFSTTTYCDSGATNATGLGTGGLRLLQKAPNLLATFSTPGTASNVAVVGPVAYVADSTSGLQIVNVTNPRQPTLLGRLVTSHVVTRL